VFLVKVIIKYPAIISKISWTEILDVLIDHFSIQMLSATACSASATGPYWGTAPDPFKESGLVIAMGAVCPGPEPPVYCLGNFVLLFSFVSIRISSASTRAATFS